MILKLLILLILQVSSSFQQVQNGLNNADSNSTKIMDGRENIFSLIFPNTHTKHRHKPIKCGHPLHSYDSRIVGGKVASIGDYPWMVSLQRLKSSWYGAAGYAHSCGGSIVTPSWIVTASHCLYNKDEPLRAVAGTDNLNFMYRAQIRGVNQPFILDNGFSHVRPICLDRDIYLWPYDILTVCGFGAKAFRQHSRTHLHDLEIAVVDVDTCNNSFSGGITDHMICAGGMIANRRDTCSGDSGGPLMMDLNDHMSLVGVVSFGNDCAVKDYPGVYTKIDYFIDWIIEHIDEPLFSP